MPETRPDDVVDAFRSLALEPEQVTAIGGRSRWRSGRSTYRVEVAGGEVFKARRVPGRADKAARAASVVAAAGHPSIPAPVVCRGPIMIDRWVDGDPLDTRRLTGAHVDAAADLLATLHATPVVDSARLPRSRSTAPTVQTTLTKLAALRSSGAVGGVEGERLADMVRRLPTHALQGVIHADLCAANLVVVPSGDLVSVDNEGLRIDFLDYDLARTWCRWPMPPWAWTRFRRRYADVIAEPEHEQAWRAVAGIKALHLWRNATGEGRDEAVHALQRVLAT